MWKIGSARLKKEIERPTKQTKVLQPYKINIIHAESSSVTLCNPVIHYTALPRPYDTSTLTCFWQLHLKANSTIAYLACELALSSLRRSNEWLSGDQSNNCLHKLAPREQAWGQQDPRVHQETQPLGGHVKPHADPALINDKLSWNVSKVPTDEKHGHIG